MYGRTPLIRTLFNQIANYPDRLGYSSKFVENSTNLTCLEITGCRIKYSTVLWLLEHQIRRGRKVQTQVHTVKNNSRTSNCQYRLFAKKNPIIRNFCLSWCLAVPNIPDKWSSNVLRKYAYTSIHTQKINKYEHKDARNLPWWWTFDDRNLQQREWITLTS
jgi:hypothetical protein